MAVSLNKRFSVETVTIEELISLGGPFEKEKVAEQFVTERDKVCGRLTESQFWDTKLPKNIKQEVFRLQKIEFFGQKDGEDVIRTGVQKLTVSAEKQQKLLEKVVENTTQTTKVLEKLSRQTDESIDIAKQSLAVQTKMVEKLDQNDEKFYSLLKQIEQNRETDKEKTERYFEESNIKFDRVMTRLERQGEENLRKIELMEKKFENEKLVRFRESTENETRIDAVQSQITQQQSDTRNTHTRVTELSDSVMNFRQTEREHFDVLRDKLDECDNALFHSAERQRVVRSAVTELIDKSDTCLSFIEECSGVVKDVHSVTVETKSDMKAMDRNLQSVSGTLGKQIHKVQGTVHQGTYEVKLNQGQIREELGKVSDKIDFKSEVNVQAVEDSEKTIVRQFQEVTENLAQTNNELRKSLHREVSVQVDTQLDNKPGIESRPDGRPKQYKGIESVGPDSSYLELDTTECQSIRPTPATTRIKTVDLSRPPPQLDIPVDKSQFNVAFTQPAVDDLVSYPNQPSQGRVSLSQNLYQSQQVSQLSQPVPQTFQVSGTEQTQGFSGFSRGVQPQGIRPIDNVNFPCEPVIQYSGRVANTQPTLVTDDQTVNRLVNTRGNAPLPKAPTFDGTGWKGFIHQFELWCSAYGLPEGDKVGRFLLALRGKANDFALEVPEQTKQNYAELKQRFAAKFDKPMEPSTARSIMHNLKQEPSEDLETFAERLLKIADFAYPMIQPREREGLAVEQFLKGCREIQQAYMISMHRPITLQDAIDKMKMALSNKTLILGKPSGVSDRQNEYDKNISRLGRDIRQGTPQSSPDSRDGKQSNVGGKMISPDRRDDQCYNCSGFGHYSRDCPSRMSPRNVRCFNCGELGHIQRRCPLPRKNRFRGSPNNSPQNRRNKFKTSSPNGDSDRNNSRRGSPTYRRFTPPRFQNRNRSVSPADLDKNWRDRSSDKDYEYQQPPEVIRRNVSFSGANLNGKRGSPRVGTPPQKQ